MMIDQIRIGRISTINPKKGTASVVYKDRDDSVTDELPLLATEYMMPKIDDLVLVLHLRSTQTGVIVGPIYNDKNRPVHSGKDVFYKDLGGDAYMLQEGGTLTIDASKIVFKCSSGSISLASIISHIGG